MSQLKKEIKSSMSQLQGDGQELTAYFCFSQEFIGFQGHFSGRPVLPGVCEIQAILCMLEESVQKAPQLKEIALAKFFSPVTCNEKIVYTVRRISEGSEEVQVLALITNREKKVAEIKLKVLLNAGVYDAV